MNQEVANHMLFLAWNAYLRKCYMKLLKGHADLSLGLLSPSETLKLRSKTPSAMKSFPTPRRFSSTITQYTTSNDDLNVRIDTHDFLGAVLAKSLIQWGRRR